MVNGRTEMAESESGSSAIDLDIVCILLSVVVKPVPQPFNSGPFPVVDHQGRIYSVAALDGRASLTAGGPVPRPTKDPLRRVTTDDEDCPQEVRDLADLLRTQTEQVSDISITQFRLQFDEIEGELIALVGCAGSQDTPSRHLAPVASSIHHLTLFCVAEVLIVPVPTQCVTRGPDCMAGLRTMERSKIVAPHIRQLIDALSLPAGTMAYTKRRLMRLSPGLLMGHVPVCAACFKYYTAGSAQQDQWQETATDRIRRNPNLQIAKSANWSPAKQTGTARTSPGLPMVRPNAHEFRRGELTPSGLRVTFDGSAVSYHGAKRVYLAPQFTKPTPAPLDLKWFYRPPSTDIK
jgi:hypothetical protein